MTQIFFPCFDGLELIVLSCIHGAAVADVRAQGLHVREVTLLQERRQLSKLLW